MKVQHCGLSKTNVSSMSDSHKFKNPEGHTVPGAAEKRWYLKVGQGDKDAGAVSC